MPSLRASEAPGPWTPVSLEDAETGGPTHRSTPALLEEYILDDEWAREGAKCQLY